MAKIKGSVDGLEVIMTDTPVEVQTQGVFKDDTTREQFKSYLQKELNEVRSGEETAEYRESLTKWRRQRIARPEQKTKNYPFPNSANVSPPISAQKVNTIYSKALANFSTKRPFWSGTSNDPGRQKAVDALAKYMNIISASPFELNLDSWNRKALYECISLGTLFYEVSWDFEQVSYIKDDAGTPDYRTLHNGPRVTMIPIEDFLTRPYWTDLQRAPWLARRFRLTYAELMERKASGRYTDVDLLVGGGTTELTDRENEELETQGINAAPVTDFDVTQFYDLYAFHALWDVNGDGVLEDIQGVMEPETGTLLRVQVNNLGVRLIGRIPYQEIPGLLYGVGVCHACEYLQDEAETLHNMRLDNLKWAMLNMFKARKGSGIKSDETVYPGKIWFMDNPNEDFREMIFPDLSQSSYQAEMLTRDYADRITGANDPMSGFADQTLKSGGGAQAQMVMMQQASSILNAQLDTMEEYYAEMGRMIAILLAKNVDLLDLSMLSEEDQLLVKDILSTPAETLPSAIRFHVETTDAARSETAKRENYSMFTGIYSQYTQTMMGYSQMAFNPQLPPQLQAMTAKFMVGQNNIMEKLIEFMKIGSPEEYLPYLGDVEAMLLAQEEQRKAQVDGQSGIDSTGMGNQQGMGASPVQGMAGVPGGVSPAPLGANQGAQGPGGF